MGKHLRADLKVPSTGVDPVLPVPCDECGLTVPGELTVDSPAMRPVVEAVRVAAGRRTLTLREARAQFEREWIAATLARYHGRVGEAAKALGIQRTNLYRKVRQLKVPRSVISGRK